MYSIMTDGKRLPLFDQAAKKDPTVGRHGGSAASSSAHGRLYPAKRAQLWSILKHYRQAGMHGLSAKEIASKLNKSLHEISGRIMELHQWGFIFKTPTRRLNSTVLVHRYYRNRAAAPGG